MPFLRVIRDKRGYETTYLMHLYREGSRQRSRILYVFRTPGDVRVGRSSLEPETLRQIEKQHPGIDFDWGVVVGNQQVVESAPDLRRPRKRRTEETESTGEADAGPPPEKAALAATPSVALQPRPEVADPARSRPPVPSIIQGDTPDDKIGFLVRWYGVCRERILERTSNAERHVGLLALAERLNPAAWTDADQITAGLLQAAEALERLSHILGKRRRRPRHSAGRASAHEGSTLSGPAAAGSSAAGIPEVAEQGALASDLDPLESQNPVASEPSDPAVPLPLPPAPDHDS